MSLDVAVKREIYVRKVYALQVLVRLVCAVFLNCRHTDKVAMLYVKRAILVLFRLDRAIFPIFCRRMLTFVAS